MDRNNKDGNDEKRKRKKMKTNEDLHKAMNILSAFLVGICIEAWCPSSSSSPSSPASSSSSSQQIQLQQQQQQQAEVDKVEGEEVEEEYIEEETGWTRRNLLYLIDSRIGLGAYTSALSSISSLSFLSRGERLRNVTTSMGNVLSISIFLSIVISIVMAIFM